MQISDLVRQYNSAVSNGEPMTGKMGVEKLVSALSELSQGNIFEGTINSVKGNVVSLGLSNGQQITARLDGKVSLTEGQSMFFQVNQTMETMCRYVRLCWMVLGLILRYLMHLNRQICPQIQQICQWSTR